MAIRTIKVGIKLDPNAGVNLFGADEVNALIEKGWLVVSLQTGGVIFNKIGSGQGTVSTVLSGCDFKINLEGPATQRSDLIGDASDGVKIGLKK